MLGPWIWGESGLEWPWICCLRRRIPACSFFTKPLAPFLQEVNSSDRHICLTRDIKTTFLSVDANVSKVQSWPFPPPPSSILPPLWFFFLGVKRNGCYKWVYFQVKTPLVHAKSKVLVPGLPGHQAPITLGSEKRKLGSNIKEVGFISLIHCSWQTRVKNSHACYLMSTCTLGFTREFRR